MGERKSKASQHDKYGNSNSYDHSNYSYTADSEVISVPEGYVRSYAKPVDAPEGGWATVNPEAVPEGENSMLQPYVDESHEGTSEAPVLASAERTPVTPSNRAQLGEDISDLIKVGGTGKTFHRSDGSGKMLSTHEMELIAEHADLIRSNNPELPIEPIEPVEPVAPVAPHETTDEEAAAALARLQEHLGLNPQTEAGEPVATQPEQLTVREKVDARLLETRDKYAELTASTRNNMWGRFLQSEGKFTQFLRKIPGVASIADRMSDTKGARELEDARNAYTNTLMMQRKLVVAEAKHNGLSDEEILDGMTTGLAHENEVFELKLIEARAGASKETNGFVNWWARQEGWSGNAKKAAVALGGGVVIGALVGTGLGAAFGAGIATGMFGGIAGISGATAAGASGVGFSKYLTDRRANALTGGEGSQTVAQRDSVRDYELKQNSLDRLSADSTNGADKLIGSTTEETERATDRTVLRNRRRARRIGGLATSAGGFAATNMANLVGNMVHPVGSLDQANVHPNEGELPNDRYADVDKIHDGFNVERGHGFIKEWMDWAQTNGHKIDSETAGELHQAMREHFGDNNIIDLSHVKKAAETYVQNGDVRIGAPGEAEWRKGVVEFAKQWMQARGKW